MFTVAQQANVLIHLYTVAPGQCNTSFTVAQQTNVETSFMFYETSVYLRYFPELNFSRKKKPLELIFCKPWYQQPRIMSVSSNFVVACLVCRVACSFWQHVLVCVLICGHVVAACVYLPALVVLE